RRGACRFDAGALFGIEVRVADFERLAAAMRPVREQFVDRGGALAVREREAGAPAGREFVLAAERARPVREAARFRRGFELLVCIRGQLAELDPCAALNTPRPA